MNTEHKNTAPSSYNRSVPAGRRIDPLRFALSLVGAFLCLCAGCSSVKPASEGSAGAVREHKNLESKQSAAVETPTAGTPAVAPAQTKPKVQPPQHQTASWEPHPITTQSSSKPVAVEFPADTPTPQPQVRSQPVTQTPIRVDRPRAVTPRPSVPMRETRAPRPVERENFASQTKPAEVEKDQAEQKDVTNPVEKTENAQPNASPAQPATRDKSEMVSVNFEQVDIRTVLKSIGEITGINFIPHAGVAGPVTVMSPTPIRTSEVYAFLQSVLDVYGYATIEMDNAVKVVPKAEAVKRNLEVHIGADPAYIPKTDTLITQILPLKYADAAEISQILEPFLSGSAQSAACPRINSILVTDTASNIHYVAQIVQQLDREGAEEKVVTFPLVHASAQVLSDQINRILEKTQSAAGASASSAKPRTSSASGKSSKVLPDDRTNTLIVVGGDAEIETIRGLVAQLDVPRANDMDNVHVTFLRNADANEVARSLDSAMAGMKATGALDSKQTIQITPDAGTNSLIVVAPPQDYEVISNIVAKLDIVREQILVELLILEVTEEGLKQIGVDWATMDQAVSNSIRGFGLTNLGPRAAYQAGTLEGLAVGMWKGDASNPSIGAIIQALQTTTGVNILSASNIVTSNHHQANFVAGESRPFVTGTRITETTDPASPTVIKEYDYKDVGVTMKITPHLSQGGRIKLDIDSEITKLLEAATSASIDTPVTAKRLAQTSVTTESDATVVIGGLTRDDTTRVEKKVPLLGDLPLLGMLFRSREEQLQKTNLLIFITPHVMASQSDWVDVSNKKREEMPPPHEWKD